MSSSSAKAKEPADEAERFLASIKFPEPAPGAAKPAASAGLARPPSPADSLPDYDDLPDQPEGPFGMTEEDDETEEDEAGLVEEQPYWSNPTKEGAISRWAMTLHKDVVPLDDALSWETFSSDLSTLRELSVSTDNDHDSFTTTGCWINTYNNELMSADSPSCPLRGGNLILLRGGNLILPEYGLCCDFSKNRGLTWLSWNGVRTLHFTTVLENPSGNSAWDCLVHSLRCDILELDFGNDEANKVVSLIRTLRKVEEPLGLSIPQQQDAHELLTRLLDTLKSSDSHKLESVKDDVSWGLSVEPVTTISEGIEMLTEDEIMRCQSSNRPQELIQTQDLLLVCIRLEEADGGQRVTSMGFEQEIEVLNTLYKLKAVLSHSRESISKGYYITIVPTAHGATAFDNDTTCTFVSLGHAVSILDADPYIFIYENTSLSTPTLGSDPTHCSHTSPTRQVNTVVQP
ncbi:hypothetical protein JCM1840_006038 [Sporobolomyces johnsonii]